MIWRGFTYFVKYGIMFAVILIKLLSSSSLWKAWKRVFKTS